MLESRDLVTGALPDVRLIYPICPPLVDDLWEVGQVYRDAHEWERRVGA